MIKYLEQCAISYIYPLRALLTFISSLLVSWDSSKTIIKQPMHSLALVFNYQPSKISISIMLLSLQVN